MKKKILAFLLCCAMVVGITACKGSEKQTQADTGNEAPAAASEEQGKEAEAGREPVKVALIYSGFLGDKSFNDLAHDGAMKAKEMYGIEVQELESGEAADWEANFVAMADADYDLVIGVSTQFLDIMKKHCPDYPDTKFALIDGVSDAGDNVVSTLFAQNEGSFLAGAAAAMFTTKTEIEGVNDKKIIGWVGGMDIPVLHDFFTGYEQGAKYIDPEIEVLQSFAGTFTDALKGKELATAQINQGADIIMNVANITGIGAMEAASELNVYAIGVDTNQDSLYPGHILTSMQKRVDICTFQMIESVVNGTYEGGSITYMDLAHDGVGLTDFSVMKEALGDKFPQDIEDKVEELKGKIASGEIVVNSYEGYGNPEK
ncbi:BMP family ABC transporter substrate-binding protein [Enterocloster sp. OA13]|uniref:BMP family lipoprotein n=1 Tax=Enterocloster TaxID=2719313 RepID=UPI0004710195|nr:BMP family ABC transporter substrate-binding protein [Lachnoclostridium pacaense]MCC2820630.1 BMP family ABC transporter substrate-binding protein [Lachnoclostridium pacaense]MCC2876173.1 BMP family ABC transporter substrate-binding protein [Lachnoclostridium pacaense]MCH1947588.1 BMP family ABC transporter substrate-binding protein [Enterocloster sp. OA13]